MHPKKEKYLAMEPVVSTVEEERGEDGTPRRSIRKWTTEEVKIHSHDINLLS